MWGQSQNCWNALTELLETISVVAWHQSPSLAWHQSPFLILPLVVMVCNHNNYAVTHAHIICLVFESF